MQRFWVTGNHSVGKVLQDRVCGHWATSHVHRCGHSANVIEYLPSGSISSLVASDCKPGECISSS